MSRPPLHQIPLSEALQPGALTITMSVGQWDSLLEGFYRLGATLLELDDEEHPIRAFRLSAAAS